MELQFGGADINGVKQFFGDAVGRWPREASSYETNVNYIQYCIINDIRPGL